jgi:hypothetical protein
MNSKTKKQNINLYGGNGLDGDGIFCFDLAFNNESATPFKGFDKLIEDVEDIIPGVAFVKGNSKSSFSRSSAININGVKMVAHSHDELVIEREERLDNYSMMMPIDGGVEYEIGGKLIKSSAKENVVFLSGAKRVAKTSKLSEVIIHIDPERLLRTEKAVFGSNYLNLSNLQLAREIPLRGKSLNFYSIFEKIFSLVGTEGAVEGDSSIIFSIDDLIYRAMVMLMVPDQLQLISSKKYGYDQEKSQLNKICEFIKSDIFSNLDLIKISSEFNITMENIEYIFLRHLNLSIYQWVNLERVSEINFFHKNLSASKIELQILKYVKKEVNSLQRFENLCKSLGWVNEYDESINHQRQGDSENLKGRVLVKKEILQRLRREKGWSQSMMVDEAGKKSLRISLATIKRAEMGHLVSFRTALSISQLFNMELTDIVSNVLHSDV